MRDAFRSVAFGDHLREEFVPEADHIFTNAAHQAQVIDLVDAWMRDQWGGRAEERATTASAPSAVATQSA